MMIDATEIADAIKTVKGISIAEYALQRLVPQKPFGKRFFHCPCCLKVRIYPKQNFCHECGTALDWRETK